MYTGCRICEADKWSLVSMGLAGDQLRTYTMFAHDTAIKLLVTAAIFRKEEHAFIHNLKQNTPGFQTAPKPHTQAVRAGDGVCDDAYGSKYVKKRMHFISHLSCPFFWPCALETTSSTNTLGDSQRVAFFSSGKHSCARIT
jgi:hypothetical protein